MYGVPGFSDPTDATEPVEPVDFDHLSEGEALHIATEYFGLRADSATKLDTERDDTFRLSARRGDRVLKVAHPADGWEKVSVQLGALAHARKRDRDLPLPRVVRSAAGNDWVTIPNGRIAFMFEWMAGDLLSDAVTGPRELALLGTAVGRLSAALSTYLDDAAVRLSAWDLQTTPRLADLLALFPNAAVAEAIDRYNTRVVPVLGDLPTQVIHDDFNPGNVLVDPSAAKYVVGILDFGDVVYSLRVADLAVALSYQLHPMRHNWADLTPMVDAFAAVVALSEIELTVLPDLVAARFAQRILLNQWLLSRGQVRGAPADATILALTAFLDLEP